MIHFAVGIERKRQSTWTNCFRPWVPKERKMSEQMKMRSLWLRESRERSEPGQDHAGGKGQENLPLPLREILGCFSFEPKTGKIPSWSRFMCCVPPQRFSLTNSTTKPQSWGVFGVPPGPGTAQAGIPWKNTPAADGIVPFMELNELKHPPRCDIHGAASSEGLQSSV